MNFAVVIYFGGERTVVNAWIEREDDTPVVRGAGIFTVKIGCFPSVPLDIDVKGGAVEVVGATGMTRHAAPRTPFSASSSVSIPSEIHPFDLLLCE